MFVFNLLTLSFSLWQQAVEISFYCEGIYVTQELNIHYKTFDSH
jgi:hypothetical protein